MDPNAYMEEVLSGQGGLSSFEQEHLSAAVQAAPNINAQTKAVLMQAIKTNSVIDKGNIGNGGIKTAFGTGNYYGGNMAVTTGQVAEFSIIVRRNTSRIKFPLPVIMFMADFLANQYQQVVNNFLQQFAPGVTLVSVIQNPTFLRWTFSNGAVSDTVDILCDTSAYPSFISSMFTTWFKTVNMRMELNNTTTPANTDSDATRQFKQIIAPVYDTNFGAFGGQRCPLTNCKPPNQFLKNVIDIPWARFNLSPREGWMLPVVHSATSDVDILEVSIAHPVQEYTRSSSGGR